MTNLSIAQEKALATHYKKRMRAEKRFQQYGIISIGLALLLLCYLLFTIFYQGLSAFSHTKIFLPIHFDASIVDPQGTRQPENLQKANYQKLAQNALRHEFPDISSRRDRIQLFGLLSQGNQFLLRQIVLDNPSLIGKTEPIWLIASSEADMFVKGKISTDTPEHLRRIKDKQIDWIEHLKQQEAIATFFNVQFFTQADSREPELAGILGSLAGSFFTIFVCMIVAFPIGVGAAIYLEEFAVKNWVTDIVEININNLAAIPSIIYGLLALEVFLNIFSLPRSSSLVGGLALSLLVLPIIVISTRNALKSIPSSIRDAATALGATKVQATFHHVVPYALPGIMTGSILSVARALGETAPLLMIGMVAFIADVPSGITSPATSLPVQVYLWSDTPEMGFIEKTSACIIVLLTLLILFNAVGIYLRNRFEYEW